MILLICMMYKVVKEGLLQTPHRLLSKFLDNSFRAFNSYELYVICFSLTFWLDGFYTTIGLGKFGLGAEGNIFLVNAVIYNQWFFPIICLGLVISMFLMIRYLWKCWIVRPRQI